jgi:hypothetical protein
MGEKGMMIRKSCGSIRMAERAGECMDTHQSTAPTSPPAVRLHRPGWRDVRFLVGLALVGLSVAVGATAFSEVARTVPVWAAAGPLVPGEAVDAGSLVVREVRLADSLDAYLRADAAVPEGLVAVRTVSTGELVPLSAVAVEEDLGLRPVAITPGGALSGDVAEGTTVDLWFVPAEGDEDAPTVQPYELGSGLTVAEVSEPDGGFSLGEVTVHVLVPVEELADVLAALADGGSVEIVPVPGTR